MRGYPLIYTVNSFLTDTSVRRTLLKDGHIWCWSLSLFSHFAVTILCFMESKYLKTEMQVLYMTVNCKLYNIL